MEKELQDFTRGNIPRQFAVFAAPLLFSSLFQIVYNMADMVVVGRALGQTGLSAVSVGGDIAHFLTFLAMGFSNAGQIIIAQYVGAGKRDKIGRFIATLFTALMAGSVVLSGVCLALREGLLRVMNTPQEAYEGALAYTTVCALGLAFIYGYNAVSAVLRGLGDAIHPFLFISFAVVLNIILDLLFVFVLSWGCAGAALATVISQGASFALSALFLLKKRRSLDIWREGESAAWGDKAMLAALCKLGFPMAIKSAAVQFSKLSVNAWLNTYGVSVSAMSGIANKVNSVSNLISNVANTTGSAMIGQNIGAQKFERVPRVLATVACVTVGSAAVMSAVLLCWPQQVFGLFTNEQAVLDIARQYLPVAFVTFGATALRGPMNALIDGSGNYKLNFLTAILDGIVMRLGLAALLGKALGMGYVGFWLGDALAGYTPALIGAFYLASGRWKKRAIS